MCDEEKTCNKISIVDGVPVWLGILDWNFVACVQCVRIEYVIYETEIV